MPVCTRPHRPETSCNQKTSENTCTEKSELEKFNGMVIQVGKSGQMSSSPTTTWTHQVRLCRKAKRRTDSYTCSVKSLCLLLHLTVHTTIFCLPAFIWIPAPPLPPSHVLQSHYSGLEPIPCSPECAALTA